MATDWTSILLGLIGAGANAYGQSQIPKPNSFNVGGGHGPLEAETQLSTALTGPGGLFGKLGANMEKGVTLPSSFVQSPVSYSGGGMPMSIGVTGSDPAIHDSKAFGGDPWGMNSLLHLGGPSDISHAAGGNIDLTRPTPPPNTSGGGGGGGSTGGGGNTTGPDGPTLGGGRQPGQSGKMGKYGIGDADGALAAFRMMGIGV